MSRRLKVVLLSVVLYSRAKLLTAIADRYSAQGKRRWQRRSHASTLYIIWVAHKGDRPQSVTLKAFKLFGLKIQLQKGKKKKRKRRIEPISPSVSSRRTNQTDQIPSLERKSVVKEEGSK